MNTRDDDNGGSTGIIILVGGGLLAAALYYAMKTRAGCVEGDRKCVGYDLYECINGEWVLIEEDSPTCGYPEEEEGDITNVQFQVV